MIALSVVIPLYNKEKQIVNTIESVLEQSFKNFEIIVVDDGSTDNSAALVRGLNDKRIRLINKPNGGVSSARNFGIRAAKNEWIVLLDADDILLPDALKKMSEMIIKYPTIQYFSGRTIWEGEKLRKSSGYIRKTNMPLFYIWLGIIDPAPRNVVVHRTLFDKYGYYDERQSFFEDWDVSIKLAKCGRMAFTDSYFAKYMPNNTGLSRSTHPINKEMAYYIPEMKLDHFWYKVLLFENLKMTETYWINHKEELLYYKKLEARYFDWRFKALHWVRQKMVNHHWI